tara:strand:- start:807 stop:914 length:108 start_codon:yes stop_codon:yes gene_type:complete
MEGLIVIGLLIVMWVIALVSWENVPKNKKTEKASK